jgi:hypothetical protein
MRVCPQYSESYLFIVYKKQVVVAWLFNNQLLLRDCGPCGATFMNVCFVINVAMVR